MKYVINTTNKRNNKATNKASKNNNSTQNFVTIHNRNKNIADCYTPPKERLEYSQIYKDGKNAYKKENLLRKLEIIKSNLYLVPPLLTAILLIILIPILGEIIVREFAWGKAVLIIVGSLIFASGYRFALYVILVALLGPVLSEGTYEIIKHSVWLSINIFN